MGEEFYPARNWEFYTAIDTAVFTEKCADVNSQIDKKLIFQELYVEKLQTLHQINRNVSLAMRLSREKHKWFNERVFGNYRISILI